MTDDARRLDFAFAIPDRHAIAIPGRIDDPVERSAWAARTAAEFTTAQEPADRAPERIALALDDLAALADDEAALFLIMTGDAAMLAPFTIYATGERMSDADVAGFLSTATTLLPPTGQIVASDHFGDGFSSTLLEGVQGAEYASRRWVFFGQQGDVAAMLGPVVPALGLGLVEQVAELVLQHSSLAGFTPAPDAEARRERLLAATERFGDTWSVR
ncbi:MAG: hypothetical protein JSS74_09935 [Actinobacteria bacterium]|nr:hypothetical protein [Actinomycetota bacterium]